MTSAYTLLADSKYPITAAQKANAEAIADVMGDEGYSDQTIMAAITNAYAESNLDACAVTWKPLWSGCNTGPCPPGKEESVGLFQLNTKGLGAGMSIEDRKKPRLNTARIVLEIKRVEASKGPIVSKAPSLAAAVEAFCRYIEKPSNVARKVAERIELAKMLFPKFMVGATGGLFQPSVSRDSSSLPAKANVRTVVLFSGLVFFGILGALAIKRALP